MENIQKHGVLNANEKQISDPLNSSNEKVYISNLLKGEQAFYHEFFEKLTVNTNIELIGLPYTKDIWCRDFMPVKGANGTLFLFNYNPSYLRGKWKEKLTLRKDIIRILNELYIEFESVDDILIDGGNVVQFGAKIIMTDAIFRENGIQNSISEQSQLLNRIQKLLNSEIIIIPRTPYDVLSHADGVVRFIDEKTVLINDFSSVIGSEFEESNHYLNNLFGVLGKAGLNILQVTYSPVDEIGEDEMPAALGLYINYLDTKNFVFLPQFGEGFEKSDIQAIKVFTTIFSGINKTIIPTNSRCIAMKAGVLNCITWN